MSTARSGRDRTMRRPPRWRCRWRSRPGSAGRAWDRRSAPARRAACGFLCTPPSRPRGASAAVMALMSSGRAPSSRSTRGDGFALADGDGALVPGGAAGGLRGWSSAAALRFPARCGPRSRHRDPRSLRRQCQLGVAGHFRRDRTRRPLPVQLAASRTRPSTSSIEHHRCDLRARQFLGEVGGDERYFGIDLCIGSVVGRSRTGSGGLGGLHLLRVECRNVGGQFGGR